MKAIEENGSPDDSSPASRIESYFQALVSGEWMPLLLAAIAFLVYVPSLQSDFVFDARFEILEEGFITSFSNLPDVLTLHVLKMPLTIGSRPGDLLYLMVIAAACGKSPLGYHFCSNLLHAANVALFFALCRNLITTQATRLSRRDRLKALCTAAVCAMIFALHPMTVETVSAISYSSDLLVAFFTLLALHAAISFAPGKFPMSVLMGTACALCTLAAATCKESGATAGPLLIIYWFLFRRLEGKGPWIWLLGAANLLPALFLVARFHLAPPDPHAAHYFGGSFFKVFWIQPRLWVFMIFKILWPRHLSADYTPENVQGASLLGTLGVLFVIVAMQVWLARHSRIGAFGVAVYWMGLATVSNFLPLFRPLADRFYYLPLAGVMLQTIGFFILIQKFRRGFWIGLALLLLTLVPLTALNLTRQRVFANEFSLWSATLKISPTSSIGENNLGQALALRGDLNEAISHFHKAIDLKVDNVSAYYNLGTALMHHGQIDEAIVYLHQALKLNPNLASAHHNLGMALVEKGNLPDAINEFREALRLNPHDTTAQGDLDQAEVDAAERTVQP